MLSELAVFLVVSAGLFGMGLLIPLLPAQQEEEESDRIAQLSPGQAECRPLSWRTRVSLLLALAGSLLSVVQATTKLLGGAVQETLPVKVYWLAEMPPFQWQARLDNLAAFFLLIIGGFAAGVAIYSWGALRAQHYRRQGHQVAAAFNLFTWSTLMVVLANDVFSLVVMLEIMTLAFGFLSLFKHKLYQEPEEQAKIGAQNLKQKVIAGERLEAEDGEHYDKLRNARLAPQVYMIISHTSTALLLVALALLAIHAQGMGGQYAFGALNFDTFRLPEVRRSLEVTQWLSGIIFLLLLAGLGIRAGLTPFHVWVPLVHPSSPTTTHALSLGIAIKVAIYCMLRFFFEFMSPEPWWGYVVLAAGVITAFVNVRYALVSHNLKEALAYHSIENIGIIVTGIGLALIFYRGSYQWVAVLALLASLYHLLNHAMFKGLLYLCTGAIDNLTRQVVEIDKLGGLMKRYSWTGALFLTGSVAIAGFPPLNGFISEWLMLQAFLAGIGGWQDGALDQGAVLLVTLAMVILVASFALTAICFFKIAGITLLGSPRSDPKKNGWAEVQTDVPWSMRVVMVSFAGFCLILGLAPGLTISWLLAPAARDLGIAEDQLRAVVNGLSGQVGKVTDLPVLPDVALMFMVGILLAGTGWLLIWSVNRRAGLGFTKPVSGYVNCGTPVNGRDQQELLKVLQVGSGPLVYLVQDMANVKPPKLFHPEYLPAEMTPCDGERPYVVERFRNIFNRWFDRLLDISAEIGATITGDNRLSLRYILIMNIVAIVVFLAYRFLPLILRTLK